MSQRRKIRRKVDRIDGNVVRLRLPTAEKPHHESVERFLLAAITAITERDPNIAKMDVLTALCRVTAFAAVAARVPVDELLSALEVHHGREQEAADRLVEGSDDAG